jgi:D-alanyl-lipoteichoic acid acyltransferase DltB (MBOAT superfamily)
MAIGAARIMGFKLMKNFDKPYQSKSISEFWKRWHISLSSWFRDYLYISLGGNRVAIPRYYFNLFIVFLVSGLWHGANWTFIIWGALHGFYLVFAVFTKNQRNWVNVKLGLNKLPFLETITTFILVGFAWIFFRASDVSTALYIAGHLFSGLGETFRQFVHGQLWLPDFGVAPSEVLFSACLIIFLEVVHFLQNKIDFNKFLREKHVIFRWAVYYIVIIAILAFGVFQSRQFIYFQF